MRCKVHIYYILLFVALCSCSETKYVAEGSYLLDKVEVEVDGNHGSIDMGKMKARGRTETQDGFPL